MEQQEQMIAELFANVEREEEELGCARFRGLPLYRRELFEEGAEQPVDDEDEDEDIDVLECSDHDSNPEISDEEGPDCGNANAMQVDETGPPVYVGKNGTTTWNVHPPTRNVRVLDRNILRMHVPQVKPCAKDANTPLDAWKLFITDEIIENITLHTNKWIRKNKMKYSRERDAAETSPTELKAVFGLLYMAGVHRSSHINLEDLWATDGTGIEFFRTCMALRRFKFLLRALRFDDIDTRKDRNVLDKLAPIRDLFESFVGNCKNNFSLSEYTTLDEMLEAFRGRCSFRQYMPNKPAKYGIKVFALVCSKTFYTSNMEIYAGTQPNGPFKVCNSTESVAKRLIQPISKTGRNVTMDNWYTSIPLVRDLLYDHRLTFVGTVKKNKAEIPSIFLEKDRPVNSSMFGFRRECTLVSYVPKKKKIVLALSSMHTQDDIDEEEGNKPEIILFYNSTKGGVDTVDELKGTYSVSRATNRWSMTLFYSLLNIGGINSFIILKFNTDNFKILRRNFLKTLSKQLCNDYMRSRLIHKNLPKIIRTRIQEMLGILEEERPQIAPGGSGRCFKCGWKKNRPSKTSCKICKKFICREHTTTTCVDCSQDEQISSSDGE